MCPYKVDACVMKIKQIPAKGIELQLRFRGRKILKDSQLIFSTPPAVMRKIINLGKEGATQAKSVEHSNLFCCPFPLIFTQLFNRSYVLCRYLDERMEKEQFILLDLISVYLKYLQYQEVYGKTGGLILKGSAAVNWQNQSVRPSH